MPLYRITFGILLVLAVVGCQFITDDEVRRERLLAHIRHYHDPAVLEVPDTVTVATPFEVIARSYGNGCVDQGDTELTVSGRAAEIVPYDHFVTHMPSNYACTDELRTFAHRATVRFDEVGSATVTARGRVLPGDSVIRVQDSVIVR
jgi:hypothetical protein